MRIYIAGSISGKSFDEVNEYFTTTANICRNYGYRVLSPMTAKGHLRTETKFRAKDYRHPTSTNRAIIGRDRWMVEQADVVYINLSAAEAASIGSMMELAWAYAANKHVVVVVPEDNIHQHAFVLQAADIVFDNTVDALGYLKDLGDDVNYG